jgi:hypothetical protein
LKVVHQTAIDMKDTLNDLLNVLEGKCFFCFLETLNILEGTCFFFFLFPERSLERSLEYFGGYVSCFFFLFFLKDCALNDLLNILEGTCCLFLLFLKGALNDFEYFGG